MILQNKKKIFGIIIAILFISGMVIFLKWRTDVAEQESLLALRKFDSTAIVGRVQYHSISAGYNYLKIHGYKNTKFQFRPITSELNENTIFFHIVEKGDSIYIPKFSDTLELIKDGKKYKYTFKNYPL